MPCGIGLHPWLCGSPMVTVNAALAYESNLDPTALPMPVGGDLDMRRPRRLAPGIDAAWPDLGSTAA